MISSRSPSVTCHPSFVYGPVPSRRLGLSLGINIIPHKTCTLDCIYCQCGRTTNKTRQRRSFYPADEVVAQVRDAVRRSRPSYLTFSGEGEPTLNRDIGRLIRRLKAEFSIPVAVITNSTLMPDPQVRRDLYAADLVVPSLDAADQRTFARVDRCHQRLSVADIIEGLVQFRRYYRGRLWLEIMLVKDVNDSVEHLTKLRRAAERIRPDRIHLNTVVRPPAETWARPLSQDDLEQIRLLFGPDAEIASSSVPCRRARRRGDPAQAVVALVSGRPVTEQDAARCVGFTPERLRPTLERLVRDGRIRRVAYQGKVYFEAAQVQGQGRKRPTARHQ
jgi:wyosine [tRNA(Phe)-imidazoG37] synthetase (radical SAM superfamily)